MNKADSGFTPGRPRGAGASEERSDVRATDKIRTCLGCRQEKDKGDIVRLVAGPDGSVVIDYKGNLPGRGAYVCPNELCIRDAFSKKQISRAFKGLQVEGAEEFLGRLRKLVLERISSLLSVARKAGKIVDGREAIEKGMEKGNIKLLVFAEDLSPLSLKEMKDMCLKRGIDYYSYLSKDEIGGLIGKGERSAVGVTDGSFSSLLKKEFDRFNGLGSKGPGGRENG